MSEADATREILHDRSERARIGALVFSVFIAGLCSIVYELLIATVSSYFLGNSVTQFSLTIGIYMAALGAGAWISRFVRDPVYPFFVRIEIVLAVVGGLSVPLLYATYASIPAAYMAVMVALTAAVGLLIGFEIPLLTRLLEQFQQLRLNISNVLSLDYLGALIATLLFPFVLLPVLGPFRSSLAFGLINLSIGFVVLYRFSDCFHDIQSRRYKIQTVLAAVALSALIACSPILVGIWSQSLYDDWIILERQTPYQRVVMTRSKGDTRLFLDGNLQFSSRDEYRYHEMLAHPALSATRRPRHVAILGGGDGLLAREVLKWNDVARVSLVDLDPFVTDLARSNPILSDLNKHALDAPRLTVNHGDAFRFLEDSNELFDAILADLPDPNNVALARLYSREFFNLVASRLNPDGVFATQATSPYYARNSFWMIVETLEQSRFEHVLPFHVNVPSFGEWGFVAAALRPIAVDPQRWPGGLRSLSAETFRQGLHFPPDMARPHSTETINALDRPALLNCYLTDVRTWR